ncbi:hypothetical protein KIPB_007005, partial [Kipferlia bialata]
GLVPGSTYYVEEDGTVTTSVTSVLAGVAVSETELQVAPVSAQSALGDVAIVGGDIDGTAIGGTTPAAGAFSDLTVGAYSLPSLDGTAGQVLLTDGAGSADWADVPSAGGLSLTARGAVAAGDALVLNPDGTVSSVAEYASGYGTPIDIGRGFEYSRVSLAANSDGVLAVYQDESTSQGYARFITVDGGVANYGTEVMFAPSAHLPFRPQAVYDVAHDVFVVVYNNEESSADHGTAVVVSVSKEGVITSGTPVEFSSVAGRETKITYDSNAEKVLIAYVLNSGTGHMRTGTVSATTISFGTAVQFVTTIEYDVSLHYHPKHNLSIVLYRDFGNSNYGTARLCSISNTSVFLGSAVVFNSENTRETDLAIDPITGDMAVVFRQIDSNPTTTGQVIGASISASTLSFGSPSLFSAGGRGKPSVVYDPETGSMLLVYSDYDNGFYGTSLPVAVSGTSVSLGAASTFNAVDSSDAPTGIYNPASQSMVLVYTDWDNSYEGYAMTYHTDVWTNLVTGTYIGVATDTASNGASVSVATGGTVVGGMSGLLPGKDYYVMHNGSLSLSCLTPLSQCVGTAVSTTEIQLAMPVHAGYTEPTSLSLTVPAILESSGSSIGLEVSDVVVGEFTRDGYSNNVLSLGTTDAELNKSIFQAGVGSFNSVNSLFTPGYTETVVSLPSGWSNGSSYFDVGIDLVHEDTASVHTSVSMVVQYMCYSAGWKVSTFKSYTVTTSSSYWRLSSGNLRYYGTYLDQSTMSGYACSTSYPVLFKFQIWSSDPANDTLRAIPS